jgi:hypothetical protein
MTEIRDNIRALNKIYTGIQEKFITTDSYVIDNKYSDIEFIETLYQKSNYISTTYNSDCYSDYNSDYNSDDEYNTDTICPREKDITHVMMSTKNDNVLFKNFAIESIDNIKSIDIEIGNNLIESIDIDAIDVFCDIYNIPKFDEKGWYNIPFYISINGIPSIDLHTIKFKITFNKEFEEEPILIFKYDTFKYNYDTFKYVESFNIFDYMLNKVKEHNVFLTFQNKKYIINKDNEIEYQGHPVFHLFVKNPILEFLELKLDENSLIIPRSKKIGDYSLFSLVDNLKDINHTINFSRVKIIKIIMSKNITSEVYAVYSNIIKYHQGMAGIMFAN